MGINVSDWGNKLIVVDYSDQPNLFDVDCLHYFKRSSVLKLTLNLEIIHVKLDQLVIV